MTISCKKCRFFGPTSIGGLLPECRRNPPSPTFPKVQEDWWCGQFVVSPILSEFVLTEELQPWDEFYKWLPTRARNGLRTLNDGKQLVDWQDFSVAIESDRWGNKVDTRDVFDVHGAFAKCQGVGWLTSRKLVEHMVRAGWPFRNKDQKTWPYDQ